MKKIGLKVVAIGCLFFCVAGVLYAESLLIGFVQEQNIAFDVLTIGALIAVVLLIFGRPLKRLINTKDAKK